MKQGKEEKQKKSKKRKKLRERRKERERETEKERRLKTKRREGKTDLEDQAAWEELSKARKEFLAFVTSTN